MLTVIKNMKIEASVLKRINWNLAKKPILIWKKKFENTWFPVIFLFYFLWKKRFTFQENRN